jgi:hypothetical protein
LKREEKAKVGVGSWEPGSLPFLASFLPTSHKRRHGHAPRLAEREREREREGEGEREGESE